MAGNRVFYILLLFAAAGIYIFTNTYYTLMLLGLVVLMPLISLALMLVSAKGISISAEVPASCEKQNAVFRYSIKNSSRLPAAMITFEVKLENQLTGAVRRRKVSAAAGGRKSVSADLKLTGARAGLIIVETRKIRIHDALGLFTVRKKDLPLQECVVYPEFRDVLVSMERPIETMGDSRRYAPEKPGSDVSELFAVREYVPGDEVRKIHWKLSSKLDRTILREFSLPLNFSVILMLDMTRGDEEITDAQLELFFSLSRGMLEQGIDHNMAWFNAGEGMFHICEITGFEEFELAAAGMLQCYAGDKPDAALGYYMESQYRNPRTTLVYLTSCPDEGTIAEISVSQPVRTIHVCHSADGKAEDSGIMQVTAEEIRNGMPEIIV